MAKREFVGHFGVPVKTVEVPEFGLAATEHPYCRTATEFDGLFECLRLRDRRSNVLRTVCENIAAYFEVQEVSRYETWADTLLEIVGNEQADVTSRLMAISAALESVRRLTEAIPGLLEREDSADRTRLLAHLEDCLLAFVNRVGKDGFRGMGDHLHAMVAGRGLRARRRVRAVQLGMRMVYETMQLIRTVRAAGGTARECASVVNPESLRAAQRSMALMEARISRELHGEVEGGDGD